MATQFKLAEQFNNAPRGGKAKRMALDYEHKYVIAQWDWRRKRWVVVVYHNGAYLVTDQDSQTLAGPFQRLVSARDGMKELCFAA